MSYLGIVVTSVFSANALLSYGLGTIPNRERGREGSLTSAIALTMVNAFASSILWLIHNLILHPLGLGSLDILVFTLIAVPALKFVSKAAKATGSGIISVLGSKSDELIIGNLVFGTALIYARSGFNLLEALIASSAAGLGYWFVSLLLESIRERLELSDLPDSLKGAPSMLVSAGLMALAFMGLDVALVKGMAG